MYILDHQLYISCHLPKKFALISSPHDEKSPANAGIQSLQKKKKRVSTSPLKIYMLSLRSTSLYVLVFFLCGLNFNALATCGSAKATISKRPC